MFKIRREIKRIHWKHLSQNKAVYEKQKSKMPLENREQ